MNSLGSIIAISILAPAIASTARAQQLRAAAEPDFAVWRLIVQHHHRADAPADPAIDAQLEQLTDELAQATRPDDRVRLERQIGELNQKRDETRGHIIYGFSMYADASGKPVTESRSMAGFMLPASPANHKVIEGLKPGMDLVIAKADAKPLFTFGGRRWQLGRTAAAIKGMGDQPLPAFNAPPRDAITDPKLIALTTSLTHNHTKPREAGELIRYSLSIKSDQPKPSAGALHVWFAARMTVDGQALGPILDHIEVPRGKSGGFSMTRSFEFITKPGVKLDERSTTATPAAMEWK